MGNCFYEVTMASSEWMDSIQNGEEATAATADLIGQNLDELYKNANKQLQALADATTSIPVDDNKDAGTEVSQAQTAYQEASAEYSNTETVTSSAMQASQQTSSSLATALQQASSFASTNNQFETDVAHWI